MDVQNDLNGFEEIVKEKHLFPGLVRDSGHEWEFDIDNPGRTQEIVDSVINNGIPAELIEGETNGIDRGSVPEIKSLPLGYGSSSDSLAFKTLSSTVDEVYKGAREKNLEIKLHPYNKKTGHTFGNHIHIGGNGLEDLMKVANIMQAYEGILIVIANPDNKDRVEAFGYKYGIAIAENANKKRKYKRSDILIDWKNQRVELRIIPMSEDLNTAFMVDQLVPRLISAAESNPEEMLRIQYLTNESPDGLSTYAEINRDRAIAGGSNAYLWDVEFEMADGSLKMTPYERPIHDLINEYLDKVSDYSNFTSFN